MEAAPRVCTRCIMDTTAPLIKFDDGVSIPFTHYIKSLTSILERFSFLPISAQVK